MHVHLVLQTLVVYQLACYCQGRPAPRDCGRVFSFDFNHQPKVGEGGIWQGQEGDVAYRDGKAWLDGRGSLTYPFFSQNDLRTGFALSFKVKPTKLGVSGRVAIITNGLTPGTSTLTIFHNETCLGVKVVEIADRWPRTRGYNLSRKVELSVDYIKHAQRLKRSENSATPEGTVSPDTPRQNDDVSITIGENRTSLPQWAKDYSHPSFGERIKSPASTSRPEDYGERGSRYGHAINEEGDDSPHTSHEVLSKDELIAVRKLYRETLSTTTARPNEDSWILTIDTAGIKEHNLVVEDARINYSYVGESTFTDTPDTLKDPEDNPSEDDQSLPLPEETTKISVSVTSTDPVTENSLLVSRITEPPGISTKLNRPVTSAYNRHKYLIVPNIFKGMEEDDPEEIEVRLAQDKNVIRFQVGSSAVQSTAIAATEHMKAHRSALRVGIGDGLKPYRGSFDDFVMYDCTPENFFKEED